MHRRDVRPLRRRQILDAAEHLAAQRGWAETTFADICREADISNGVLTYHFKTKNDILFAMLEDIIDRLQEYVAPRLQQEGLSLDAKIAGFVAALSEFARAHRELILLLVQFLTISIQQPEVAEKIHAFFSQLREQQVDEVQQEGVQLPDDPHVIIRLLHCLALGLVLDPLFLGLDVPIEQLIDAATRMFLGYLRLSQE
ncbi:MAG TPA: TetR/AcrR family transcriptional regulator [Ktedonobacteraceae bacterium]|nr:TetR/AcrR family transcriptional regulator [Ktedonobacteraceae bacterium]